jgi:hypothetical protein
MASDPEQLSPQPVELPKAGEHLIAQEYMRGLQPAVMDPESNEYRQPPSTPDSHGRHVPKIYQVSLTEQAQQARDAGRMSPEQFRRARAENGTGPGGTKSPAYWEPSSALPGPAALNVDFGAELEVVGVQTDQLGDKELVVRYVSGPADFFPGGNRNNPGIKVDEIGQIDGAPKDEFFGRQVFTISGRDETVGKLKPKPAEKPPSGLVAAAKRLFGK